MNLQAWRERGSRAGVAIGALVVAGLLTIASVIAASLAPRLHADLATSGMVAESGFAYLAPVTVKTPFGFSIAGDWVGNFNASTLQLAEDGRLLGPGHAAHDDIRSLGNGRYSHWWAHLYFSSSDSTDPR